ncbi:2-oxo-4-hydroxy-4-carboxy-5-ureidoimidazoline decarboxylase [Pseudonocardia humida]|uniref:2-oxo-4-hydroxy-4-carboxy-5-ureidoimidazoline decarboxylase n=1 Tax=Pseudonocardia humida TaxID=2800819 RepID=A0ABT0ZX92_9PSEU|nr:2-oxo-4-hydroxy-4-carboxy-5-ureidoimidazoline decarboxylase [Pseudonocardia humida]MCO1655365.1 2-oxo-4-hydroxy-4-carboxy-5-ureidoimidazoline decarboxylase [Pseudonocardia humida]
MRMAEFDQLPGVDAEAALLGCCASPQWARRLAAARPYGSPAALLDRADAVLAELDEAQVDLALAGHPRIGERSAHASSAREQAGVAGAPQDVRAALAEGNREYEARFGHVYLVCADGRPAGELLAVLRSRLHNDPATERAVLRAELAKINRIRLGRLVEDT